MTVVAYPHIQPQGSGPWIDVELRSVTQAFRSPLNNATRTLERPGAAWAFTVRYQNLTKAKAARLSAFLASCRGMGQRFYLPVWVYDRRGSGFGSELFTNGTFANGTTDWTGNDATLSAPDYVLRIIATELDGVNFVSATQSENLANNVPHALRSVIHDGRGSAGLSAGAYIDGTVVSASDFSTDRGLSVASLVTGSGAPASQSPLLIASQSGFVAGDYMECSFASLARCALVDNGPNLLLRSDEFDNAAWTNGASSETANNAGAPDGTVTADDLIEDGSSGFHYIEQAVTVSSTAADYTLSFAMKAGSRTFGWCSIFEGTHSVSVYFNLTTGALDTPASDGANFIYPRAHAQSLGNGWWKISLTGRKTSASTSVTARIGLATALGTGSYAGDGSSYASVWRATLAQSSVPTRLRQTTSAATSGTSQTGGALHLKGLPASTNGLLLAGDWVQLPGIEQLVRARTALNSDAAGLGYFEFEPFLRDSPADNSPVIVTNPLARCLLDSNSVRYSELADNVVDIEFTAVEDVVP